MVNHALPQLKKFCQAGLVVKDQGLMYFDDIDDAIAEYKETYVATA